MDMNLLCKKIDEKNKINKLFPLNTSLENDIKDFSKDYELKFVRERLQN